MEVRALIVLGLSRRWYQNSAERGYAAGMSALGQCHEDGLGTEVDMDEALLWFRKAKTLAEDAYRTELPAAPTALIKVRRALLIFSEGD